MTSPQLLYSVEQARALDALAIAQGTSGYTLMRRAGEAALRILRSRWPRALQICVVAGGGNNGGDGYVLARFAQAAGLGVRVLAVVAPDSLKGDARLACDEFRASGGHIEPFAASALDAEVIVDALLGTGLTAAVRAPIARDADGLALSSRNQYLTAAERAVAPRLHRTLLDIAAALGGGPGDEAARAALERQGVQSLTRAGFRVDYVAIRDAGDLSEPQRGASELVVLAAAWLGSTRLIDNVRVTAAAAA